jgi:glycosyltransferase involved in cell wall biosynthesis
MKIAYVSAGAAGMLCGSCVHDNTLAAAIRRLGHDIVLIPTYTPTRTDEDNVSMRRVFYGAVNIYLQDRVPLFSRTPRLLGRLLDHPWLLALASRLGSSTSAADLGGLTLSVLSGEEGRQRKELQRLVWWLRDDFKPEIVHLTNSMFLGLAGPMKRELGVPVICSVQGEDLFLEGLPEPWRERVLHMMRAKAKDADLFIATSREYGERMREMLEVPERKMLTVPLGLNLSGHGDAARDERAGGPFVIGYLARICPEKGLHLLAEGFHLLARRVGADRVALKVAGYLGPRDRAYFAQVTRRIESLGLAGSVTYLGEVDRAEKIGFLNGLDVLCVPTIYRESKGLSVLEALANGVPAALPRHGSFPEILEKTGGGVMFPPGSATGLAEALLSLMDDPVRRRALGESGRVAVKRFYSDNVMAEETLKVYLAALSPGEPA